MRIPCGTTLFLLTCIFTVVRGGARLEWRLTRFDNPTGDDADSDCCDYPCIFNTKKCDHQFKICVGNTNGGSSFSSSACPHFYRTTGEYRNDNDVSFGNPIKNNIANPIIMDFDRWPGSVRFRLHAEDNDDSRPSGHDFVDTHNYLYSATPDHHTDSHSWSNTIRSDGNRNRGTRTRWYFKVKLYCRSNYYGSDCNTHCIPRNDNTRGHYTCNSHTGAKQCRTGYEHDSNDPVAGRHCGRWWNDCMDHGCENGATCVDRIARYECICAPGYTGTTCAVATNECSPNPCLHGSCTDLHRDYRCTCSPGYLGAQCSRHVCDNQGHCQNGGRCYDIGHCQCTSAWTGPNCETPLCDVLECGDGSIGCENGRCQCLPSHEGTLCNDLICDRLVCFNNATCENGICHCPPGITDEFCGTDILECSSEPCLNSGICEEDINSYDCSCLPGYGGSHCELDIDECLSNPCGNGNCTDGLDYFTCECDLGYYGSTCDSHVCDAPNYCLQNGTCGPTGHCDCPLGYIGERCERDACEIIDCGEYSVDCEAGHCSCMSGYEGSWCDQLICDRIQCYHGSTCNLGECNCVNGTAGQYCESYICTEDYCKNGGICTDNSGMLDCICDRDYTGTFCETYVENKTSNQFYSGSRQARQQSTNDNQNFQTWLFGLIGAVAFCIIVIIILVLVVMRYRRRKPSSAPPPGGVAVVQAIGPVNNALYTPDQQSNPLYDTAQIQLNINQEIPAAEAQINNNDAEMSKGCNNPLYGHQAVENDYSTIPELKLGESETKRRLPDLPPENGTADDLTEDDYQRLDDCIGDCLGDELMPSKTTKA